MSLRDEQLVIALAQLAERRIPGSEIRGSRHCGLDLYEPPNGDGPRQRRRP